MRSSATLARAGFLASWLVAAVLPLAALRVADTLDFGSVPAREPVARPLELANDGRSPVTLSLAASCGCVTVAPRTVTLAPGGYSISSPGPATYQDCVLQ